MLYENKFMNYFVKVDRHLRELMMPRKNNSDSYNILIDLNIIQQEVMKLSNFLNKKKETNLILDQIYLQFHRYYDK